MTQTTKTRMTSSEAIAVAVARGYALDRYELHQVGIGGDYYVNSHKRAVGKALREIEATKTQSFVKKNETLVALLTEQTQELKAEFLTKTRSWSESEFARFERFLTTRTKREAFFSTEASKTYGTSAYWEAGKEYRLYNDKYDRLTRVVENGVDFFVARELKLAELHYESSIVKLALRIEKKELDQTRLVVKSARLEMNFETTISDGVKSVRAFTILAFGDVQRPHYRYLVK